MMGGIVGRLFREFAVVLSVAIAMSMVISLTATPMMCAWLLKEHREHGWLYNWTRKILSVGHLHLCVGARGGAESSRVRSCSSCCSRWASTSICTSRSRKDFSRSRIPGVCRATSWASSTSPIRRWWRRRNGLRSRSATDPDVETVDHGGGHQRRRIRRESARRSTFS